MFDNQVLRNQFGWSNTRDTDILSDFPQGDWTGLHNFFIDFDQYTAADWTVTKVGTGTNALVSGDGGILQVQNSAANGDSVAHKLAFPGFKLAVGQRFWGRFMFQVDSTLANVIIGMHNSTTTPYAAISDGIYLTNSGSTITINVQAGGSSVGSAVAPVTLVAGSMVTFTVYWEGNLYRRATNGAVVWQLTGPGVSGNARGEIQPSSATFPSATLLNPAFAVQNSTAAARTLLVDMVDVANERYNINTTPAF